LRVKGKRYTPRQPHNPYRIFHLVQKAHHQHDAIINEQQPTKDIIIIIIIKMYNDDHDAAASAICFDDPWHYWGVSKPTTVLISTISKEQAQ